MERIPCFPVDVLIDEVDNTLRPGVEVMLNKLIKERIVFVYSHRHERLNKAKEIIGWNGSIIKSQYIIIQERESFKSVLDKKRKEKDYTSNIFIIFSNKDVDMHMAATNKLLFFNPRWHSDYDENALKYGLDIRDTKFIQKILEIIDNQKSWFYHLKVSDKTTVYSLIRANSRLWNQSSEEKTLVEEFENTLKRKGERYYSALLLHFLSGMTNIPEFSKVQDWAIVPSSKTELNETMLKFKERARYLMGGRKPQPIFERHTATYKSQGKADSLRYPCDRHFDTIRLNPVYKGKLKNRTVCVFDDYLTNGTMFETVRNLLESEGVKKVFLVSLGRFRKNQSSVSYLKQNYQITDDVFSKSGFNYSKINEQWLIGSFDNDAIKDIEKLYDILHS